MSYEIDFIPVGNGERSGDAICLRYGNIAGRREEQTVITIDGGTTESGDAVVDHLVKYFGTDTVDIAFLTHPDADHASGMRQIVEKLRVKQVAMHLPWNHSTEVHHFLDDGRTTVDSITERAKKSLSIAREIEQLARRKNIPIVEPFAGASNSNGLVVLGPTREFYQESLIKFRHMPATAVQDMRQAVADVARQAGQRIGDWLEEHWLGETLRDPMDDATSAENNSSLILLLNHEGRRILFTGDVGTQGLAAAVDFAVLNRMPLDNIVLFQAPHHGSRRNIGPTVLNRLFGSIRPNESLTWSACISAGKDGAPKHPHKKVTNALRRRGANVCVTAGNILCYQFNTPARPGWTSAPIIPFYDWVEHDD